MDKSTYMQELVKCRQNYDELFGKLRLSKNQQINFSYSWWEKVNSILLIWIKFDEICSASAGLK